MVKIDAMGNKPVKDETPSTLAKTTSTRLGEPSVPADPDSCTLSEEGSPASSTAIPKSPTGSSGVSKVSNGVGDHDGVDGSTFRPTSATGMVRLIESGGRACIVKYVSSSGAEVSIPRFLNPYEALGVSKTSSIVQVKTQFRAKLNSAVNRCDRAMASLAYHMITCTKATCYGKEGLQYEVVNKDPFFFAVIGDTTDLMAALSEHKALLTHTDEHGHTLLYLAARSGYHDTTLQLLKAGAPINVQQVDGSTSLHAASYYGQKGIVEMLLEYGADTTVKNKYGNTPVEEAYDEAIEVRFENFKKDMLSPIINPMLTSTVATKVELVQHEHKLVAKKVYRCVDQRTMDEIKDWELCWHGTKSEHLSSIFKHGLKPSGTMLPEGKVIKPPTDHFPIDFECNNIKGWPRAVFVSPSLLYASHRTYAEEIGSEERRWRVVVMGRLKPGCYAAHDPTTFGGYSHVPDEPRYPEYRISVWRVESDSNVVVLSALFISTCFLEDLKSKGMNYKDIETIFM